MTVFEHVRRGISCALLNWRSALAWFAARFLTGVIYIVIIMAAGIAVAFYVRADNRGFDYDLAHQTSFEETVVVFAEMVMDHWLIPVIILSATLMMFLIYASVLCFMRGAVISTLAGPDGRFGFSSFMKRGRLLFRKYFMLYFLFAPLYHFTIMICAGVCGYGVYYSYLKKDGMSIAIASATGILICLLTVMVCLFIYIADMLAHISIVLRNLTVWQAFLAGFSVARKCFTKMAGIIIVYILVAAGVVSVCMALSFTIMSITLFPLAIIIALPLRALVSMVQSALMTFVGTAALGSYISFFDKAELNEYEKD